MDLGDDNNPRSPWWVIEIKNRLNGGHGPDAKSSWTIDRVPSNWREVHNNAFDAEMIHMGPFESLDKPCDGLQDMEKHKIRFLIRLLGGKLERWRSDGDVSRTTDGERVSDDRARVEDDDGGRLAKAMLLDDLVEAMQILEQETRACYSSISATFDSDWFVRMMVVDGCFVVELLRLYYDLLHTKLPVEAIEDDPIFTNPRILTTLRRDLLLLENQPPLFVLEKLYELINKKNNIDQRAVSLEELAVTFFDPLLPQQNAASKLDTKIPKAHLLEVFRSTFLKSVSETGKNQVKSQLNPYGSMRGLVRHFASELQEAGVRFRKRKDRDLLKIHLEVSKSTLISHTEPIEYGTLWVPTLSINDHTISLLLNFVGYEMSVHHPEPFFTNYFMFWDSLVNSPRDIQIFRKHGIINDLGRDEDVANLLIRCREVIYDLDLGYLCYVIKWVNEYCDRFYERY